MLLKAVGISPTHLCSCKETCWPTDDVFHEEQLKIDAMNVAATIGPDNRRTQTHMHWRAGTMNKHGFVES